MFFAQKCMLSFLVLSCPFLLFQGVWGARLHLLALAALWSVLLCLRSFASRHGPFLQRV